MDFDLSEEQTMVKDGLSRLLANEYDFEKRNSVLKSPEGWSPDMWRQYSEMGLTALPFSEEDGGLGGSAEDMMIVMEAFGHALSLEPYFATVVLGGGLLRASGSNAQRESLIGQVCEGSLKLAFAHSERNARYELSHVETTAKAQGNGYVLNGEKSIVLHGDSADKLFVSARVSGNAKDEEGIALFLIDANSAGVSRRGYKLQDGTRAAEVSLQNVSVENDALFGEAGKAFGTISKVVDQAIAALCAEAVGVMGAMQELTVEYLKTRKQFGIEIGKFQSLQHGAVDMFVAIQQARSITNYATMMSDSDNVQERARAMAAAKAEIGRGGRLVGEHAVQLHGGVGMTMEYAIGHYFKRITMLDIMFGDSDYHLRRLAQMGSLFEDAS